MKKVLDWLNGLSFRTLMTLFGFPIVVILSLLWIIIFWIPFGSIKSFKDLNE